MKYLSNVLILAGALSVPVIAQAQPYNKAHQIKASEAKGFTWPTLKRGNVESNSEVMAVQYLLRNRGFYKSKIDGDWGEATDAAVKKFQRAKGLKADGVIGPQTWPHLLLRLKRGDRGDAVRALQILLRDLNSEVGTNPFIGLPTDGNFGSQTEKVVRSFQEEWMPYATEKVKVDGIVGPRTWGGLLGAEFDK